MRGNEEQERDRERENELLPSWLVAPRCGNGWSDLWGTSAPQVTAQCFSWSGMFCGD